MGRGVEGDARVVRQDAAVGSGVVEVGRQLRLQSASSSTGGATSLTYYSDSNQAKTMTSTAAGTSEQGVDTSTGERTYWH